MRPFKGLLGLLAIMAMTLSSTASHATLSREVSFRLDEGAGTLTVMGRGLPPSVAKNQAQARLMAERAAVVDAYAAAASLLSKAMPESVLGKEGEAVFLRGARFRGSDIGLDGSATVMLEIPVTAELAARVKGILGGQDLIGRQEIGKPGISHEEYVAQHRVRGRRVITMREWIDRYKTGSWVPYNQLDDGARK